MNGTPDRDSCRIDGAEDGIHVATIEPGAVDTELLYHIPDDCRIRT